MSKVSDADVEVALAAKQSAFYGVPSGPFPHARDRIEMRAALEAVSSIHEKDGEANALAEILRSVDEQFDIYGNSFPDGFDHRVFRWVKDALAAHPAPISKGVTVRALQLRTAIEFCLGKIPEATEDEGQIVVMFHGPQGLVSWDFGVSGKIIVAMATAEPSTSFAFSLASYLSHTAGEIE